eukprot:6073896-Karenia_brevis.AAC.1
MEFPDSTYPYIAKKGNMKSHITNQLPHAKTEYRNIAHQQNYVSLLRAVAAVVQDHSSGALEAKLKCAAIVTRK